MKVGNRASFTRNGQKYIGKIEKINAKTVKIKAGQDTYMIKKPDVSLIKKTKKSVPKKTPVEKEKPSLKNILLDLDIDVSNKIAKAVEDDKKIDFYEITNNGGFEGQDEMDDMKKSIKPDGKKDLFGKEPKWINGITNGNAGTTGTLSRVKARQIKNKYKKLTIKRFVETDKPPYHKLVSV